VAVRTQETQVALFSVAPVTVDVIDFYRDSAGNWVPRFPAAKGTAFAIFLD
jgi:hypothetical protein